VGRLDGKVAIVTGAGGGIGRAMVVRLAEEGAQVVAADVNEERAAETAKLAGASYEVVDVSQPEHVERLVATAVERHGKLTTMCNNAAISIPGNVTEVSLEDFDRTISVNLRGVFLGCKYAVPALLAAGGGSIVNTGSVNSLVAEPFLAAYCASKGGVLMLSKAVAWTTPTRESAATASVPAGWTRRSTIPTPSGWAGSTACSRASRIGNQSAARATRRRSPTRRSTWPRTSRPS
jgi:NAD(P)-dependent dehydrogenase (short-subunit alcohol dehydrogenase family)